MQAQSQTLLHPATARPHRRDARTISTYVGIWMALATAGLGYLAVIATRPALVSAPAAEHVSEARTADLSEQLATTKGWLRDLETELGEARRQLSAEQERSRRLSDQLALAEAVKAPPLPAAATPAETDKSAPVLLPPIANADAAMAPTAGLASLRTANQQPEPPRQSGIVTGALTTARAAAPAEAAPAAPAATGAITFGAPKVVPAATPSGIEIGEGESLDVLRQNWASLSGSNTDVLRRLSARYRISGGSDKPFTLMAGPFPTSAEARRACNALKARGVLCKVGDFVGNAM